MLAHPDSRIGVRGLVVEPRSVSRGGGDALTFEKDGSSSGGVLVQPAVVAGKPLNAGDKVTVSAR